MTSMEIPQKHLVIVRHGESEGDLRRAAFRRGEAYVQMKSVDDEGLTERGIEQNRLGGLWIRENILAKYGIEKAAGLVSPTRRTMQAAVALDLPEITWQADERLTERNRGLIKGWRQERHKREYPHSYEQMLSDPVGWTPPGKDGESIGVDVVQRLKDFLAATDDIPVRIIVAHRDVMWAIEAPLEEMSSTALAMVDTNQIKNGQIWDYTDIDPQTREAAEGLVWKRSVSPWASPAEIALAANTWTRLGP